VDDYRTLTELRKRSAGDQSIISIRIDEDDSGEEEEGREETRTVVWEIHTEWTSE